MKSIRYFLALILTAVLLFSLSASAFAVGTLEEQIGEVNAKAVIAVDADTGEVLYEQNSEDRAAPASTIKILTALLILEAIENGELSADGQVTVTSSMLASVPDDASTMWIPIVPGEIFTVEQLLYAHMISSDCRASNCLAFLLDGSVEKFCERMNSRADELGCTDSHFTNPSGYPDSDMYTTARDLLRIATVCMEKEAFCTLCSISDYTIPATNMNDERTVSTTNRLIAEELHSWTGDPMDNPYYNKYATGIKTGSSTPSGQCLISAFEWDGHRVYIVILGAPEGTYNDEGIVDLPQYSESIRIFEAYTVLLEERAAEAAHEAFREELAAETADRREAITSSGEAYEQALAADAARESELQAIAEEALAFQESMHDRMLFTTGALGLLIVAGIAAAIVAGQRSKKGRR